MPSISPGENRARSSRTCALMVTTSILSTAGGLEPSCAWLMAAGSSLAAAAGSVSQPTTIRAIDRRFIAGSVSRSSENNEVRAGKFLAPGRDRRGGALPRGKRFSTPHQVRGRLSLETALGRPLQHRLFARLGRFAEIMGGIDQRNMGKRLREVSG